jgi:hypothetical protein
LQGFIRRAIDPLLITPTELMSYKIFGRGLGTGTVAAGALASGGADDQPVWAENEWSRVLLESGPILGLAYLILRLAMTLDAYIQSMQVARRGNLLAIAMFGAAGPALLTGQFGQPTSQGGATLAVGLCLAALNLRWQDTAFSNPEEDPENPDSNDGESGETPTTAVAIKPRRGRAPYAEMLHRK